MRQVKISSVQYEMLVSLRKQWRMKPKELIAELIEENYKRKLNDENACPQQVSLMSIYTDRLDMKIIFVLFSICILWH